MIELSSYQHDWKDKYNCIIADLSQVLDLSDAAIFEHIGSTAIEGLTAKPVIDIMLGVANIDEFFQKNKIKLDKVGYDYVDRFEHEFPYRRYFQLVNDEGVHLVHLHVVNNNSCFWRRHLLFRNYLRSHQDVADAYVTIKKEAKQQAKTRDAYTTYKSDFIYSTLRDAFINLQFNPSVIAHDHWHVVQPEPFMQDIIAMLYPENTQQALQDDIEHWERYGYGLYWWQDKASGEWVGRAGYVSSNFGPEKPKWMVAFTRPDYQQNSQAWQELAHGLKPHFN